GLTVTSLVSRIPLISEHEGSACAHIVSLFRILRTESNTSAMMPIAAIIASVAIGLIVPVNDKLYYLLEIVGNGLTKSSGVLNYIMPPLILMFGIKLGVTSGISKGASDYLMIVGYTAGLCGAWWLFYTFIILRLIGGVPVRDVLTKYYL